MTAVTVHHLELSRSHRILWLLEELEVPYELVEHRRTPKTFRAPASMRQVHPLGKSPAVILGEGADARVLVESGAVIEELLDVFAEGRLRPEPGTDAFRRYRFFLHWAEGSMMPPLVVKLITGRVRKAPLPFFVRPVARRVADTIDRTYTDREIEGAAAFVEAELEGRDYLCGDAFTAADIQMSYPILGAASLVGPSPRIEAYLDRLKGRRGWVRAVERGGPPIPE